MDRTTMLWNLLFLIHSLLSRDSVSADDIILGGIFPEHSNLVSQDTFGNSEKDPCGDRNQRTIVDKAAMDFAVQEINNSDSILPGISLQVNTKDSCNNLDHAIENTLNYSFVKRKFIDNNTYCLPQEFKNHCCVVGDKQKDTPVVALIAGGYSHVVKAIVNLVGLFKVPVIGYSSTSPSLNKIDYFLRTVPSDAVTVRVMVDLIQKFNWNIVMVLYANTEFGHYAADSFRTAIRRKNAKICIAFDESFSRSFRKEKIKEVVEGIQKEKKSRVVAFFGTMEDFMFFHEHSKEYFNLNDYMWITSEIWLTPDLIGISPKLENLITIIPKQSFPLDRFYGYLRNRSDVNLTCLPTSTDLAKHFHGTGTTLKMMGMSMGDNCSLAHSKYIPHVFDAVYAVAMALHNMLECERGVSCKENIKRIEQRSSLLEYLRNLSFSSPLTNNTISFDSNGNPDTAYYTAIKLTAGNNHYKLTLVGHWTCRNNTTVCAATLINNNTASMHGGDFQSSCGVTCAEGMYKSVKEEFPDCCWECKRCKGNKYTNSSNQLSCLECANDQWPNSNHTACKKIHPETLDVTSASGILILVWDTLGIALSVLVGVVFIKYSSSHIVRASSRQLSLLLLVGITMSFSLLISLLAQPTKVRCTVVFVLSHVAGCLLTGTLFLRTNRIHRIFRKSAMKGRPRCLGNACQLLIILTLVTIEVILTILTLFFHPETGRVKITYVQRENERKAFALCYFFGSSFRKGLIDALLWSYNCGLIFICTYQAYLVRKVPENYNEARFITFTMVTVSMSIIVYVITGSGMEGYNLELVYCIFHSVQSSVALGCMFFPKVYIILFQPEKNVPHKPVQSQLGTFVEDDVSTVKVNAEVKLSNESSSTQSVSSADSGTSSQIHVKRSNRKVGVELTSRTSAGMSATGSCLLEDAGSKPRDHVEDLEREVKSTVNNSPNDCAGIITINGASESSATA